MRCTFRIIPPGCACLASALAFNPRLCATRLAATSTNPSPTASSSASISAPTMASSTSSHSPPVTDTESFARLQRPFPSAVPSNGTHPAPPSETPPPSDVTSELATKVDLIRHVQGPWLVSSESVLDGELHVEADGMCFFHPASPDVGQGVGVITLIETPAATVLRMEIELYRYKVDQMQTPARSERVALAGILSWASVSNRYRTLTLSGQVMRPAKAAPTIVSTPSPMPLLSRAPVSPMEDAAVEGEVIATVNAARVSPWRAADFRPWLPDATMRQNLTHLFPTRFLSPSGLQQPKREGKNLDSYQVSDLQSCFYIPNYISLEEESKMVECIQHTPPELVKRIDHRTVQEYGCTMCPTCGKSFVSDANQPPWCDDLCDALVRDGIYSPSTFPNSVRVHEYRVGDGIGPHTDGPIYIPRVALLSLASPVVMNIYPRREPHSDAVEHYNDTFRFDGDITQERPLFSCVLEPRSLFVFAEDVYYFHPHGIRATSTESLALEESGPIANAHLLSDSSLLKKREFPRQTRMSVTIRHLLPRCEHGADRARFFMRHFYKVSRRGDSEGGTGESRVEDLAERPIALPTADDAEVSHQPADAAFERTTPAPSTSPEKGTTNTSPSLLPAGIATRLDRLEETQEKLRQQLDGVTQQLMRMEARDTIFQQGASSVLNHVSSVMLEVQSRVRPPASD